MVLINTHINLGLKSVTRCDEYNHTMYGSETMVTFWNMAFVAMYHIQISIENERTRDTMYEN